MPTIGQCKSFGFERAVRRADFECADLLRLGFVREDDALRFRSRFALMAVVHVSGPSIVIQASIPNAAATHSHDGLRNKETHGIKLQLPNSYTLAGATPNEVQLMNSISLAK